MSRNVSVEDVYIIDTVEQRSIIARFVEQSIVMARDALALHTPMSMIQYSLVLNQLNTLISLRILNSEVYDIVRERLREEHVSDPNRT